LRGRPNTRRKAHILAGGGNPGHGGLDAGLSHLYGLTIGSAACHFYETRDDLLETLRPFKVGLEAGEFCAWVVSEPLTEEEVWQALERAVPSLDR
jgi:hypothetical protein